MNIDFSEGPASLGQLVPTRVREAALSLTYGSLFALPETVVGRLAGGKHRWCLLFFLCLLRDSHESLAVALLVCRGGAAKLK